MGGSELLNDAVGVVGGGVLLQPVPLEGGAGEARLVVLVLLLLSKLHEHLRSRTGGGSFSRDALPISVSLRHVHRKSFLLFLFVF